MTNSRKVDNIEKYYDEVETSLEYDEYQEIAFLKKKRKLDPYNKHKERRNSKINPRFIELDEDDNF